MIGQISKRILIVLTSCDQLANSGVKTGFWLEESAAPFNIFKDAGMELTLASPRGGQAQVYPKSELADAQTDATRRFSKDAAARAALADTLPLGAIKADIFDAVFVSVQKSSDVKKVTFFHKFT